MDLPRIGEAVNLAVREQKLKKALKDHYRLEFLVQASHVEVEHQVTTPIWRLIVR